jgi:hypothetical protein
VLNTTLYCDHFSCYTPYNVLGIRDLERGAERVGRARKSNLRKENNIFPEIFYLVIFLMAV